MGVFKKMMEADMDEYFKDETMIEASIQSQIEAQDETAEEERLIEESIAAQEREHKNV